MCGFVFRSGEEKKQNRCGFRKRTNISRTASFFMEEKRKKGKVIGKSMEEYVPTTVKNKPE